MAAKKKRSSSHRRARTGSKTGRKASHQVRTEMHQMRSGKRKVESRKQAIAIGLNKARKQGARIPRKGSAKKK